MNFYNRVKFTTSTTGTGAVTVGTASTGFRTPADAGIPTGTVVRYVIEDPLGSANWETGYGTYTSAGTTLSRNVMQSSNSDSLLDLSGSAVVRITALAEDVYFDHSICQGRLTLTSGTPVTTSDVAAATSIYFTPLAGSKVSLYSANWKLYDFSELTLSLTDLAASKNYDVFLYDNSGTLTLESVVWTNNTTRATALVLQNGIYVKSGETNKRYLGTFRTTATIGQCEDSISKRFLWNHYNRAPRYMSVVDTTNTWTYNSASWRAANNNANNKVEYVCGVSDEMVMASVRFGGQVGNGIAGSMGVGIDTASANSAQLMNELSSPTNNFPTRGGSDYLGYPGLGYHYIQWVEYARAGTVTFFGDNGIADLQSGLIAVMSG